MIGRPSVLAIAALAGVAVTAFVVGRHVEERRRMLATTVVAPASAATPKPERLSYQALHASDVLAYSFADFYEALRSAPTETRRQWAAEVEQMPAGPRRRAAVTGFYKLLIQFDPAVAIKSIREIQDKRVRDIALEAAVNAVPGFAMADLALVMVELYREPDGADHRYDLFEQWTDLDPAAVARFQEQHNWLSEPHPVSSDVISTWAQLDPKAAKEWLDRRDEWKTPEYRRAFISGWYESDRAAAVSYVLAHATEPDMRKSLGTILRGLYYDAKDEARKFIEDLPDDRLRHDAFRAAFEDIYYVEVEESGDPALAPRAIAEWMVEFPPAYWRGRLKNVFKRSQKPPREMISWVEQQPLVIQDAVAAEYTPPDETPAVDGLGAVLQVADPRLRDQMLAALFRHAGVSRDEFRDAIAKAPLSTEQRDHVLGVLANVESQPKDPTDEENR